MTVLITGAAGFIGMSCAAALLARGDEVVGIDNLNAYYDPALKRARLDRLAEHARFRFEKIDVADAAAVARIVSGLPDGSAVLHLAAQAGVRYSLENPGAYVETNVRGQLSVLEAVRHHGGIRHLAYASSSSVYGGNTKMPFAVEDRVDRPISLYAATKRSAELMSWCYAHLYGLPQTGLRYFTVYGPWGRPDMSAFIFARAILSGAPIPVFNHGDMLRDFTFIDDIVAGTLAALDRTPGMETGSADNGAPPHRLYNLGNNRPEHLMDFIGEIEKACGRKAILDLQPMQPGDVKETCANIDASVRDLAFSPKTTIAEGIPRFVAWFRDYHGI
ncbi:MAG: NAD-dependent epimerase/dehydratase family protein [Rhodospirillaceae bacterium]|nr:NAD-dependent epimerase/dehydratase family protein [Rhodospirillaceae bacterium]